MSGLARLFAQRGDEAVREVPADRLFEALEGRLFGSPLWSSEGGDVREDPRRGRWSDLCEHGGTHGTGIGTRLVGSIPGGSERRRFASGAMLSL